MAKGIKMYSAKTKKSLLIKTIEEEKALGFNPELVREHEKQLEEAEAEIKSEELEKKKYKLK
jgi:hypothetical protein